MHRSIRAQRPRPFVLNTLAAALLAGFAQAEEPAAATELETITVSAAQEETAAYTVRETTASTRLPLSLRETPQSVTVITRERMDDQNMQSLREVLDNTTGVYSYAYDTERVLFTARGFVIDNTSLDGVPTLTRSNTNSTDASLDTALYERIEVVRGATGLLTGAGNPSAAINLVRKHADSSTLEASAELSAGSWNNFRSEVDVSTPLTESGKVRARVVGVYQNRESYMDVYSNEKSVFYGVIDADLTDSTQLSVGYDYQKTLPQGNTWGSFPLFFSDGTRTDWPSSVTTATNWSFWNNTSETGFIDLRHNFGNDWSIRASLAHRETDGDMKLFYVYGFPDKNTGLGLTPYAYRSKESGQQNSADVYASGPFQWFDRKHELVIGATAADLNKKGFLYAEGTLAPVGNFYEWDGAYPEPAFATTGSLITQISTDQTGFYSVARLSLADPLKLIAGARYSSWKTDSFDVYNDSPTNHYRKAAVTPYAGLVYDINENFSAFTSYTEIFKPQDYRDVSGTYLDPVNGSSIEVGIKGEHYDGRLNTALTLFDTRQNNVATADTGNFLPDGITQAYYAVDGAKTRGFELEASGELATGWNASAGLSHYTMEDAQGDDVNSYIPRTLLRVFSSWRVPGSGDKLTLGGGANWQSKSNLDVEHPTNPGGISNIEQGSVTLISLMARYQFTPKISAQLNGENLLDKKYYVLDEYGNLYYAPPANATLSFNYKL